MIDESAGASIAWIRPEFAAWRDAVARGDFAGAERMLASLSHDLAVEARELMRRLHHDWPVSANQMLEKLRAEIPDVTRADIDAWTASGSLQSFVIDGERRYFRREPRNLFIFDHAARNRMERAKGKPETAVAPANSDAILPVLVDIVAESEKHPGERELMPIRTRFNYSVVVKPDRPGAQKGSTVRAWLPFPQAYAQQRDVRLIDSFPRDERVSPRNTPQRTVYFRQKVRDPAKPVRFEVSFEYTTRAVYSWHGRLAHDPPDTPAGRPCHDDLCERPPHVVFTDAVKRVVAEQSKDAPDKRTLAKRLWNWVDDAIAWRAEHEYCLIPSIPEQAMRLGRGDCGTQALTLISLCRFAGIPARWQSGWTTDPVRGGGLHDWCEIWLDEFGWVPCDPSFGKKPHADERVRDFYFGGLDPYRLIVNLDYGRALVPPKASLRSEPLDFQRGEVELDGRNLYFDEWDYTYSFEHESAAAAVPVKRMS